MIRYIKLDPIWQTVFLYTVFITVFLYHLSDRIKEVCIDRLTVNPFFGETFIGLIWEKLIEPSVSPDVSLHSSVVILTAQFSPSNFHRQPQIKP